MRIVLTRSEETGDVSRKCKEARAALQAAITEGIESGEPKPFDAAAFKLRMRESHASGEHRA